MKFRKQIPCPYILVMIIKKGIEEEKDSSNKSTFQFFFPNFFLNLENSSCNPSTKGENNSSLSLSPGRRATPDGQQARSNRAIPKEVVMAEHMGHPCKQADGSTTRREAKRNESTGKKGKIFFTKRYVGSMPKGRRITICKSTSPLLYVVMFS